MRRALVLVCATWLLASCGAGVSPPAEAPPATPVLPPFESSALGVIVNTNDPDSVAVADAYMAMRAIPARNRIEVALPPGTGVDLTDAEARALHQVVYANTPPGIEAYAVAWTKPYSVATRYGLSAWLSRSDPDATTRSTNSLLNATTRTPWTTHQMRPTMLLAGSTAQKAVATLSRGLTSDGARPTGTAWFVENTGDPLRGPLVFPCQHPAYVDMVKPDWTGRAEKVSGDLLEARDIVFYAVGAATLPNIGNKTFIPGAIAWHATSCAGQLVGSTCGQTSALEWLENGAGGTGAIASYGTVSEPINITARFPNPGIVLRHYRAGDPALLALWKAVGDPSLGVFVGDPLAAPFTP